MQDEDRDVWTKTTPDRLARFQNHTYMLQALSVRLELEDDSARTRSFQQKVLPALKERLE
jgi:hypothetical protein